MKNKPGKKQQQKPPQPIRDKEDVQRNPDERIDQDFPGYPHPPSKDKIIKPKTPEEKATANVDQQQSDGSANAFSSTEQEDAGRTKTRKTKEDY